jgi:hypothetical protein
MKVFEKQYNGLIKKTNPTHWLLKRGRQAPGASAAPEIMGDLSV